MNITSPINFVKFRMQRPEWGYTGMMNAIVTINRDEGPLAFWKGVEAVFMRNTICMLGMVYGYKEVRSLGAQLACKAPTTLRVPFVRACP